MNEAQNPSAIPSATPDATPQAPTAAPAAKKPSKTLPEKASGTAAKMEVTVLLKDIILPDDWNREKLVNIPQLAQSIKEVGLIQPLVVRPAPDKPGKVILNDGRRRYAALQEAGVSRAAVYIKTDIEDDTKAFLTSLVANLNREDNTDYEIAVALRKLSEEGMKNKEIAKAVGKSEAYVSQHINATKVHADALEGFKKGKISFAKVRLFEGLKEDEDAKLIEKLIPMALDPENTTEDMSALVNLYSERKAAKGGKKRGASAKTRAEKKRGPAPKFTDYDDADVRKLISIVPSKDKAVELLNYAKDRRLKSSSSKRISYFEGMIDGMELFAGLKVLE